MKLKRGQKIRVMYDGELRDAVFECRSCNPDLVMVYLEPPTLLNNEPMLDLVRRDEIAADK